jgi:hypothetical protein
MLGCAGCITACRNHGATDIIAHAVHYISVRRCWVAVNEISISYWNWLGNFLLMDMSEVVLNPAVVQEIRVAKIIYSYYLNMGGGGGLQYA